MHILLLFLSIARAEPACTEAGPVATCDTACVGGEAAACVHAAALKLVAGDPAGARSSWERGCDLGDANACQLLASASEPEHPPAEEVPAPEPPVEEGRVEAPPDLAKACKGGSGQACYDLAILLPATSPLAKMRLLQACELKHAEACAKLEALSRQPHHVPRSDAQR